jgi:hypothetical protein
MGDESKATTVGPVCEDAVFSNKEVIVLVSRPINFNVIEC